MITVEDPAVREAAASMSEIIRISIRICKERLETIGKNITNII